MNNNPVLDSNLACIAQYNPNLRYKILQVKELKNNISFSETVLKEPNLEYNGVLLHDVYGAEVQAKEIFSKIKNDSFCLHVIYGFGLGYLFQEFALNSKGLVFVYEPDIEILAATLEVADFSKELSKKNVFIFNDFDELKKCYASKYIYNSSTFISFLPSYKQLFENNLSDFVDKLNFVMGAAIIDANYVKNKLIPSVKEVCHNLDSLVFETPLNNYKNIYDGKSVLVVSAGPSLDKNIETIKKYRDKVIIISAGQALRTLVTNDIYPDFTGLVETTSQMAQIEGLDISNIDLILEPATYRKLHKSNFKNKISYPSKNSPANLIWASFSNTDVSQYISSGTVSYMLIYSAMILGFKDIILVGQDLAFIDGKCYSKISQHNGLVYKTDENTGKASVVVEDSDKFIMSLFSKESNLSSAKKIEIAKKRIETINKNLYSVRGIKGDTLATTLDYASFIRQFEDFANLYGNTLNLYNTSLEGAKINGFIDMPLEEILKNKQPVERIDLKSNFSCNIKNLYETVSSEIIEIENILKLLTSAAVLISNYDKEFKNRNCVNEKCIKYFKQLMLLYTDITEHYCPKNKIFAMLQRPQRQELNYSLQIHGDGAISSINCVYQNLKIYMENLIKDLSEVKNILKLKAGILYEMSDTKS